MSIGTSEGTTFGSGVISIRVVGGIPTLVLDVVVESCMDFLSKGSGGLISNALGKGLESFNGASLGCAIGGQTFVSLTDNAVPVVVTSKLGLPLFGNCNLGIVSP